MKIEGDNIILSLEEARVILITLSPKKPPGGNMKIEGDNIILSLEEARVILKTLNAKKPPEDLKNVFLDLFTAVDLISEKNENENEIFSYAFELKSENLFPINPVPGQEERFCKCGLPIGVCIFCYPLPNYRKKE